MRLARFMLFLTIVAAPGVWVIAPAMADEAGQVRSGAFRLLNQGVAAYRKGDYATAIEKLTEQTHVALNNFRGHYYLGLAQIGDRRYREATKTLEIALDLDPTHLQSHVAMGDAQLKMGDLSEAEASYFRSLRQRAEYAPALDGQARIAEARGEDSKAISTFQRALASDAGFAPAYTHLGDLYLRRGEYEEAVQLLEEAVSVRPDFAAGLNRLALAYGKLGLDNQAVATIQRAMEFEPYDATHPCTLGWLQLGQGFVQRGEQQFLRALQLDPSLPDARMGLAQVARRRGAYELALGQLDTGLSDSRLDSAQRVELENLREEIANEQTSLQALQDDIADGTASEAEYSAMAEIYARRGQWSQAVEFQQQAGAAREEQERLAYMLFRADRFREAYEIYARLATEQQRAELEVNSGVSVARLGRDDEAVAAYRRALEIDPDHRQAQLYLGNSLLRLGRTDDAVAVYRDFLMTTQRGEAAERVRRILQKIAPSAIPAEPAEASGPQFEGEAVAVPEATEGDAL